MSYECFRDMPPIARLKLIECARLYSREWMRKKRASDPDFCQRERDYKKLYRENKRVAKENYMATIGPLDKLTDEELIFLIWNAAAVFFGNADRRLLEELIRRFRKLGGGSLE
jgi:hypothetical protein